MTATMWGSPGVRRRVIVGWVVAGSLAALGACAAMDGTHSAVPTVTATRPSPQVMADPAGTAPPTAAPGEGLQSADSVAVPATVPAAVPAAPPPTAPVAPPPVPTTVPGSDDGRAVQRLESPAAVRTSSAALGLLRVDWRTMLPGWQIRFLPGRVGLRGATFPDRDVIEIYVRANDRPEALAHVVAHELGHAVDVSRFGEAARRTWRAARGIPAGATWFPSGSGVADFASPAGDWAESFAHWLVGAGWNSHLGPPPNEVQRALIAQLAGIG